MLVPLQGDLDPAAVQPVHDAYTAPEGSGAQDRAGFFAESVTADQLKRALKRLRQPANARCNHQWRWGTEPVLATSIRMTNDRRQPAKHILEGVTGAAHPPTSEVEGLIRRRKANAYRFRDDGRTPNNPHFPVIHYRSAVDCTGSVDPASIFELLFKKNGWGGSWRDSVYPFLHFHTQTHEVLGIARGKARVQIGGTEGRTFELKAGDVIILPAGAGHRRLSAAKDFQVVGAYPSGGKYDEPRPTDVDREVALAAIKGVKTPRMDPVYGRRGPLRKIWKRMRTGGACDASGSTSP